MFFFSAFYSHLPFVEEEMEHVVHTRKRRKKDYAYAPPKQVQTTGKKKKTYQNGKKNTRITGRERERKRKSGVVKLYIPSLLLYYYPQLLAPKFNTSS